MSIDHLANLNPKQGSHSMKTVRGELRLLKSPALKRAAPSRQSTPRMNGAATVSVWTENAVIPTYMPAAPDKNPMFLEKRVYQGSSGKVYPLPFTDRNDEKPVDRKWKAVW